MKQPECDIRVVRIGNMKYHNKLNNKKKGLPLLKLPKCQIKNLTFDSTTHLAKVLFHYLRFLNASTIELTAATSSSVSPLTSIC